MSAENRFFGKRKIEGPLHGLLFGLDSEQTPIFVDLRLVDLEMLVPDSHVHGIMLCEHNVDKHVTSVTSAAGLMI